MRVGIYLPRTFRPCSIDFEGCAQALSEAGHTPVLVCPGAESPFPGEVAIFSGGKEFSPDFWRGLRLDLAIFYNWFHGPALLAAARSAGVFTVTRADSDGLISARVFPEHAYRRLVDPAKGPLDHIKRFRHFLNWHFFHWRFHDKEALQVIELSDRVAVETPGALNNFRLFLNYHKKGALIDRFGVVPHAVPDAFLQAPIGNGTRKHIFCGGRWDDDQKDARLLGRSIPRILERIPEGKILIAGRGADVAFGALGAKVSRVQVLGLLERTRLPEIFAGCRFLLSSSRWESHPIGALEALCCGCTVASTPTPGFEAIVDGGRFGTLSENHSPEALASAATTEAGRWDLGERKPEEIASHWRGKVSHKVVIEQMLTL